MANPSGTCNWQLRIKIKYYKVFSDNNYNSKNPAHKSINKYQWLLIGLIVDINPASKIFDVRILAYDPKANSPKS